MSLRLVLAISMDGRLAPPQGGAAKLGNLGDRRALEEALVWADCCLMGAGTLRAHRSSCLIHQLDLLEQRKQLNKSVQPPLLLISRSNPPLGIEPDWPFWQQPFARWLLAPAGKKAQGFERFFPLGPWPQLKQSLAAEGVKNLLLLGGAELTASLMAAGVVDELQLTLCPLLLGGKQHWLPPNFELPAQAWQLVEARELGASELLVRYKLKEDC